MRVGIITFHFVNNFGGALQTYGLYRVLRDECGVDPIVVDYRNRFIQTTDWIRTFPISTSSAEIRSGFATRPLGLARRRKFRDFVSDNMALTDTFHSCRALEKNPPRLDALICGSDQIWNPVITAGVEPAYYGGFASDRYPLIAYAPSFGGAAFNGRQAKRVGTLLQQFDHLSVREPDGADTVERLLGKRPVQLVDPTLLVNRSTWNEAMRKPGHLPERYVLLYMMQHDMDIYRRAREVKAATGLPVVEISRYGYHHPCVDEVLVDVGPAEFLYLFAHASNVCTNSFHGLAFALIFERPLTLMRSKRFAQRIDSLLSLLGMDGNASSLTFNDPSIISTLEAERGKAMGYLRESLGVEA